MGETKKLSVYETLSKVDTKNIQEQKNGLTYLSWAYALDEIYKRYPDAIVDVRHWDGKPYLEDEHLGYWVEVTITIEGVSRTAYLPVMNYKNQAIAVGMATFTDINKAIQRTIAKACALHGLSLNIYAGSDIPLGAEEGEKEEIERYERKANKELVKKVAAEYIDKAKVNTILKMCKDDSVDSEKLAGLYRVDSMDKLTISQFQHVMQNWDKVKESCGV